MDPKKKIIIIGSGFSSVAASCYLSKAGYNVTILEKNKEIGGRARRLTKDGFVFDMGPTFYWMPDVFDDFFADFGKKTADYYNLIRLDPGYQVYFGEKDSIPVSADFEKIKAAYEELEVGSGEKLQAFIDLADDNYQIAIKDLVYQPGESIMEIVTPKTVMKLGSFVRTIKGQVASYIKNDKLRKLLEFPVLFLGAKPSNTPSFYNFMNYADLKLGTWHPKGGMYEVILGMQRLALELGVKFKTDEPVTDFILDGKELKGLKTTKGTYDVDIVLSGADYHHTESLLPLENRQYTQSYWDNRTFAPSALMFYVGFDKKIEEVEHHTLFFDTDFEAHAKAIYDTKEWPAKPLFYASFPSKTDENSAPEGKEAGIFLIPIAPDIEDSEERRNEFFDLIMKRLSFLTGQKIEEHIIFKESFCVSDFKEAYNSCKGNAYGLANTLLQTHILRPNLKSSKLKNLYFTGQLTVPGPGVPPALISGKIVSDLILKYHTV